MKLLILCRYGVFGGRLVQLLGDLPQLEILVAGRNLSAAKAFCRDFEGEATLRPFELDRANAAKVFAGEEPDLIIDASGPFQDYGEAPYSVVEAAIVAGIDYVDFADGSDFVFGIAQFNQAAKQAVVFVLSWASSFPVLTAAVLSELSKTTTIRRVTEGDDGPFIPSMAIEGIVRQILAGQKPKSGARAATGAVALSEYETLFSWRTIYSGWRETADGQPAYKTVLGPVFPTLPPLLQALHQPGMHAVWKGRAGIIVSPGLLTRLLRALFRFPDPGTDAPVSVTFSTDENGTETWQRDFAGQQMHSTQAAGTGRNAHLIVERFGPFSFGLAGTFTEGKLTLTPRR